MTTEPINEEELENLRIENEIKKIKLTLERGAHFSESDGLSNLDPAMEAEFLKNIEMFENTFHDCKQISVYDFIGKPQYKKAEDISEESIGAELEKIISVMNDNGIYIETLCPVEDNVLYTFITKELFLHEIDDIRVKGMMFNFIYEEFHPNHEHDIRIHCNDFMLSYLNKESDFYKTFLANEEDEGDVLRNFRDAYSSFSLEHFEIITIYFDEEKANVNFNINFSGTIEGSNIIQYFSGEGIFQLQYLYDFWCIQRVEFPAVS